jgi:beta-glucosidase
VSATYQRSETVLKLKSILFLSAVVALATWVKLASGLAGDAPARPKVEARAVPLLKINNLTFKDLNRNGSLDPYEDWRLPVEKRAADLLSKMTLEEKAGLMQITSLRGNVLADYVNNRNIHYLILRDNLSARELAARANTSQELAEKSRLGIPLVFTSNPRNHVRDTLVYE